MLRHRQIQQPMLNSDVWELVSIDLTLIEKLCLSMTCKETFKFVRITEDGQPVRIAMLVKGLYFIGEDAQKKVRLGKNRIDYIKNDEIKSIKVIQTKQGRTLFEMHRGGKRKIYVDHRGESITYFKRREGYYKKFENVSFFHIFTGEEMCNREMVEVLPSDLKRLYYQ